MKHEKLSEAAAKLYVGGLSIDNIALKLGINYRTARKAIFQQGVTLRDPSTRLLGRTRPDRNRTNAA